MKEIEVKARVPRFDELIAKLRTLGCALSKPHTQHDVIYLAQGIEFPDIVYGTAILRIRNSNGTHILTLKQQLANELEALEYETVVDDPHAMHDILTHMGYHRVVEVRKIRRTCAYNGTTICMDEVESLGNFVEVERLTEEADGPAVQEELFRFLETLGVTRQNRVRKGYDKLMYELKKEDTVHA